MAVARVLVPVVTGFGRTLDRPADCSPAVQRAKQQGFFDYALGKINPHGQRLWRDSMESRRGTPWCENTIDDLYFWSNVVTLLLLSGLGGSFYSNGVQPKARSHRGILNRGVMERPRQRQDRD